MLNDLKRAVCRANRKIHESGLVTSSWGNVSGFDMSMGLFVIKPSGIDDNELQPEQMLVVSMDGQKVEGRLNMPWDAAAHQSIYMINPMVIGSIVHLQSEYVTVFAQADMPIPVLGTTHAGTFGGAIPITAELNDTDHDKSLAELFGNAVAQTAVDYERIPAVLVRRHGAFVWGQTPTIAVHNAILLERVAKIAFYTTRLEASATQLPPNFIDKCMSEIEQ